MTSNQETVRCEYRQHWRSGQDVDGCQDYGLREHPHGTRDVSPYTGVTLACTREQEAVRELYSCGLRYLDMAKDDVS